jgi:NADPH:quinone reductase-like Zn-dependent oxidoreductase
VTPPGKLVANLIYDRFFIAGRRDLRKVDRHPLASFATLVLDMFSLNSKTPGIIDFAAAAKHGVKTAGNSAAANAKVLAELASLIDAGRLKIPIAKAYPLADVREAYQDLARRHTRGKIVLVPPRLPGIPVL